MYPCPDKLKALELVEYYFGTIQAENKATVGYVPLSGQVEGTRIC